jgi:hypothetical protein
VKFAIYLLLAVLLYGVWKTHRSVRRSQSPEERFFAIRASALTWVVGLGLLTAFVFLPGRARILLLLPAFVIVVSLVKFWQNARARLQREREEKLNLDRMKRVN